MTDFQIFCFRLRNLALTKPYRSAKYKAWLKEKFPKADDPHHICGSVHGMKSSDLLAIMVTRKEHGEIQHKPVTIEQVVGAIQNLMLYVEYLESKGAIEDEI